MERADPVRVCESPTPWQWCIHGDSGIVRPIVADLIPEMSPRKTALRYALCGCGDRVCETRDGHSFQPMRCGHRLCPRCSAAAGKKYVRRVLGWLAAADHGDLLAMCCTQLVVHGERLRDTRARLLRKYKPYLRLLRDAGMTAHMATTHIVWSVRSQGWHVHTHLVIEAPALALSPQRLLDLWHEAAGQEIVTTEAQQSSRLTDAGGRIPELAGDNGDTDFFEESQCAAIKAIQYPIRDACQGVSFSRLGGDPARVREACAEILAAGKGWRLRALGGRWRAAPPPLPEDEAAAVAERSAAAAPTRSVGRVNRVFRQARRGDEEARGIVRSLEKSIRCSTSFTTRLVKLCRWALGEAAPAPQ